MSPKANVILDFFQSTWEDKMDRLKVGWQQNAFHRGGVLFLFIQCAMLPIIYFSHQVKLGTTDFDY